jgi:hypothetical protein
MATFTDERDILRATRAARERRLKIVDVFAPYAVHGLDEAMGLQPSRLPWVCLALGVFGAAFKIWFEFWTTATDWPLNVGGKPWNSLPAFVPITFEVMVLFAGLSTVFAFLLVSGLRPWKKVRPVSPRVTDDAFVLVLEQTDSTFDPEAIGRMLASFNAAAVEERVKEEP